MRTIARTLALAAGILCLSCGLSASVLAQSSSVSQDLLNIYSQTKSASTEGRVTSIISACKKIASNSARNQVDRDYAISLVAWGLNRRGEMRSDQAAELVASGKIDQAKRLDELAATDFQTAIKYVPNNWRTHHNYAISLAMEGLYQRAIQEFDTAIELKPDYANSYFNRAELYFETEDYAAAIQDYSRAIEVNAKDPQYYNGRAHSKFMLEGFEDALVDYRKACELASDNAIYQTDLADAYQYLGRWKDAARTYQAAVAADNKYPRAYQNAAWLMATCPLKSIRNPELSLAAAKKALELGERTARALDTLAAAHAASGKQLEAQEIQAEAIQLAVDTSEKSELQQRLSLYQKGSVYRQPEPIESMQGSSKESLRIRTAQGGSATDR